MFDAPPSGGQPVQLWFDGESRRLVRSVRVMPISTLTERYSGYREAGGLWLPHRFESNDSGNPDVEVIQVDAWRTLPAVDSAPFSRATPPDDTHARRRSHGADRAGWRPDRAGHAQRPRLRLHPRNRGGHSIITPQVAQELELKPEGMGASGGAGTGTTAQQYTRIDEVRIGNATMRDQHFYVLHFSYATVERGPRPPLAGLLGLELFERFGARLDYRAKTLTLRQLAGYQHRGGGVAVPITFDDDMPGLRRAAVQPRRAAGDQARPRRLRGGAAQLEFAGLRRGTEAGRAIVAVDGITAPKLSGAELRAKLLPPVGTTVKLAVERDGKEQEVALRLVALLP